MQNTNAKEPWLAVCLSLIYTGVGQIYSGDRHKGIVFIIVKTIFSFAALAALVWFIADPSTIKIILAPILPILGTRYLIPCRTFYTGI